MLIDKWKPYNVSFLSWFLYECSLNKKILMFLTSLLVLSPFGPKIINIGGFYIVEIYMVFMVLYLVLYERKILNELIGVLKHLAFIVFSLILFCLLIIGWIIGGDFFASYSDFRTIFILGYSLMFFLYSSNHLKEKINIILFLSLISIVLSIIYSIYFNQNSTKNSYPMFSVILMLYLSVQRKSPRLFILSSIIAVFVALTSFYRSYWILSSFSILFYYFLLCFNFKSILKKKFIYLNISLVFLLVVGYYIFSSGLVMDYFTSSESRYIQSVGKWEELVYSLTNNGNLNESDNLRLTYYVFIKDNIMYLLLPHGIGYESFIENLSKYFNYYLIYFNPIDSGILYLSVHFGVLLSMLILFYIMYFTIRKVFLVQGVSNINKLSTLGGIIIIVFYSLISGDIFTVIQKAFFFGCFLGIILNSHRIIYDS